MSSARKAYADFDLSGGEFLIACWWKVHH